MRPLTALLCASLLAAGLGAALAVPLKTPTPRKGDCFNKMKGEIVASDQPGKGYGIIFYGDSITESLRGSDKCGQCEKSSVRSSCTGVPQVLSKWFGKWRPGVMGMSMDQTANLLWRLMSGEIPRINQPKVAVIQIGANDFTNCAWSATDPKQKQKALDKELPGIFGRIQQAVELLLKDMPKTQVVVLGVLPRGTGSGKGQKLGQNDMSWPSHYTKATNDINKLLRVYADKTDRVSFVDCGAVFITKNGRALDDKLMADAIHPTAAGWEKLATCLAPSVGALMQLP